MKVGCVSKRVAWSLSHSSDLSSSERYSSLSYCTSRKSNGEEMIEWARVVRSGLCYCH